MRTDTQIDAQAGGNTRMLFLGDAALTDGFQLIGFETWADPTAEKLDKVLEELLESKGNAFIILDTRLAESSSPMLERVRREGRRILITVVPPLNDPEGFRCDIDHQVNSLMNNGDLSNKG
jgi:vacuolar-type H+-ATPase subunit F/Vma7